MLVCSALEEVAAAFSYGFRIATIVIRATGKSNATQLLLTLSTCELFLLVRNGLTVLQ